MHQIDWEAANELAKLRNIRFYQGRMQDQTYYWSLPGHASRNLIDIHYSKKAGWAYVYEISLETYAQHVPPIVWEKLLEDPHGIPAQF